MILGDKDLKETIEKGKLKIEGLQEDSIRENGIDLRIGNSVATDILIEEEDGLLHIINTHNKESSDRRFEIREFKKWFVIPPKTNILLVTKEIITLPNNLMAFCAIRSSIARMGFISPITIVDAGFSGSLTIEAFYGGNNPIKLYVGDRFLHLVFAKTLSPVEHPYSGFYQGQKEVNLPKTIN